MNKRNIVRLAKNFIACILLFTVFATNVAFAHSGRTDSRGGHKDNKNASGLGSYHYHHGYSAHLHTNGICPYDTPLPAPKPTPEPTPEPTPVPTPEPTLAPDKPILVVINGQEIDFDQPPILLNGRILVSVRQVVEALNCFVTWDNETETVYVNEPHLELSKLATKTDAINVYVNNDALLFPDQQPVNINGRILIPIRDIVEKLNCAVKWDEDDRIVYVDEKTNATSNTQ